MAMYNPAAGCQKCPLNATRGNADPVWGFGDKDARMLILGKAPTPGALRAGRPFTGEAAGNILYPVLNDLGLASRAVSLAQDDGMTLSGVWVTDVIKCPPFVGKDIHCSTRNQQIDERHTCIANWLAMELDALEKVEIAVILGDFVHMAMLQYVKTLMPDLVPSRIPFRHGAQYCLYLNGRSIGFGMHSHPLTFVTSKQLGGINQSTHAIDIAEFYYLLKAYV